MGFFIFGVSVCMCVCVCSCVRVCACVWTFMHLEAMRLSLDVFCCVSSFYLFEVRSLSKYRYLSHIWQVSLHRELQVSPCICFPCTRITGACYNSWLFMWVLWTWMQVLMFITASTFLTKVSLQSLWWAFKTSPQSLFQWKVSGHTLEWNCSLQN